MVNNDQYWSIMFSNDQMIGKCKRRSSLNVDTCEQPCMFKDKKYA